jgi:hypothetical protein
MINNNLIAVIILITLFISYNIYSCYIALPTQIPDSLTEITDAILPSLIPLGHNFINTNKINDIIPLATESEFVEATPEESIVSKPAMVLFNKPDYIPTPKTVSIFVSKNRLNN